MRRYTKEEMERLREKARQLNVIGEPEFLVTARVQGGKTVVKVTAQISYGKRSVSVSLDVTDPKALSDINLELVLATLNMRDRLSREIRERAIDVLVFAMEEGEEI